jgi:hypothetical protein
MSLFVAFFLSVCKCVWQFFFKKTEWADRKEKSMCFWLKTKWWWCPTTPTHPTSLLATFFVPTDEAGFEREALC